MKKLIPYIEILTYLVLSFNAFAQNLPNTHNRLDDFVDFLQMARQREKITKNKGNKVLKICYL